MIDLFKTLCWCQGVYYVATGIWPLISVRSFQAVTGRKTDNWTGREGDHWLVMTVAVLVTAIGAALIAAGLANELTVSVLILAAGCNVALTGIAIVYVSRGVISPIYLVDAVAEVILLVGWIAIALQR